MNQSEIRKRSSSLQPQGVTRFKRPSKYDEEYQSSDQDLDKTSVERDKARKDKEMRDKINNLKPIDPDLAFDLDNNKVMELGSKSSNMPFKEKLDVNAYEGLQTERQR